MTEEKVRNNHNGPRGPRFDHKAVKAELYPLVKDTLDVANDAKKKSLSRIPDEAYRRIRTLWKAAYDAAETKGPDYFKQFRIYVKNLAYCLVVNRDELSSMFVSMILGAKFATLAEDHRAVLRAIRSKNPSFPGPVEVPYHPYRWCGNKRAPSEQFHGGTGSGEKKMTWVSSCPNCVTVNPIRAAYEEFKRLFPESEPAVSFGDGTTVESAEELFALIDDIGEQKKTAAVRARLGTVLNAFLTKTGDWASRQNKPGDKTDTTTEKMPQADSTDPLDPETEESQEASPIEMSTDDQPPDDGTEKTDEEKFDEVLRSPSLSSQARTSLRKTADTKGLLAAIARAKELIAATTSASL